MQKQCKICSNTYDYCPSCTIKGVVYKSKGMCSQECYDISNILQRYGCKLLTPEETIQTLKPYDIENKPLQSKIEAYYQNIKAQLPKQKVVKPKVEFTPIESVEVVIEDDKDTTTSEEE